MRDSVPHSDPSSRSSFQQLAAAFLAQPGLPFASVLSAERIERAFAKHGNLFGRDGIYSTVIMAWSFLGQVLRDGKEASCQAAVARVAAHQQQLGAATPTADTGDYCRARAKLSEHALHDLASEVASELEQQAPSAWLWKGRHAKLVDGFTFTMPDTPANQAAYPQHPAQKPGVGFPVARACAMLSLATACVRDLALGPYAGKETGETALLRELFASLDAEDVLVADRYYCSFLMIALLLGRRVDVCARMHQSRHVDFRRGRRLGKSDHLVEWNKPARPAWMDEATYAAIPATIVLREIRFQVVEPGRRARAMTVVTTLLDAETYTKAEIAALYGFRWNSELDIRSIKQTLNLSHLRCKSPAMVRRELWTTLLAYNLIRTTAAAAAMLHDLQPRQISFTGTCLQVLASWALFSAGLVPKAELETRCRALLRLISQCQVANRPGRLEPRQLKRRRHGYKLMQQPRASLRAQLKRRN
jgi:putative transposase